MTTTTTMDPPLMLLWAADRRRTRLLPETDRQRRLDRGRQLKRQREQADVLGGSAAADEVCPDRRLQPRPSQHGRLRLVVDNTRKETRGQREDGPPDAA